MGYETDYRIRSLPQLLNLIEVIEEIDSQAYADGEEVCFSAKWYDCEDDMRKLSFQHPNTLFIVKGFGEESGDIWVMYSLNGRQERLSAEIVFPPSTLSVT